MTRCVLFGVLLAAGCGVSPPDLDVSSPRVVSVVPSDGAVDVLPTSQVTACLDRSMNPLTVTSADVVLSRIDGHQAAAVPAAIVLSPDATCITASPASPLAPASHYRLDLEKGLLSAAGIEISSKAVQFTATFTTIAPAAEAIMLIPIDGMLNAPLDLSRVLLWFSAPVELGDAGDPFALGPATGASTLSADGRLASAPFPSVPAGASVSVTLSSDLHDPSGQVPLTGGPLGFTMGRCPEGDAPSLGEGLVLARDSDALLSFAVDRPSLCGALVADPSSPDAGSLASPAQCQAPYDPCAASMLCLCTVALVGLGPGDAIAVTPTATGFDGKVGAAPEIGFDASPELPKLVLTEVRGGSKSTAFVEVQNRGGAPLDLLGLNLADCGLSLGCSAPKTTQVFGSFGGIGATVLAANGYALLVDPSFEAATAPPGALLLSPRGQASLLSLSETKAQSLALFTPSFAAVVSSYDGSVLPKTGVSLERIDPATADPVTRNWALSNAPGGTPAACNSVTSGSLCDAPAP